MKLLILFILIISLPANADSYDKLIKESVSTYFDQLNSAMGEQKFIQKLTQEIQGGLEFEKDIIKKFKIDADYESTVSAEITVQGVERILEYGKSLDWRNDEHSQQSLKKIGDKDTANFVLSLLYADSGHQNEDFKRLLMQRP